jgi:hypothetical protein
MDSRRWTGFATVAARPAAGLTTFYKTPSVRNEGANGLHRLEGCRLQYLF